MLKNAIVLCSGGLDSVTTAHYAKKQLKYDNLIILFFDYNQRNKDAEEKCSRLCAKNLKAEFIKIDLPFLSKISTSMLNTNNEARKISKKDLKDTKKESSVWYVPFRNALFLSYATALAESLFVKSKNKDEYDIFVGFKHEGKENYPDTTPGFVKDVNKLNKATMAKPKVFAPLIKKDKEDIVRLALKMGIEVNQTHSCYTSNSKHCGICLSCQLRRQGFYWANQKDETEYLN